MDATGPGAAAAFQRQLFPSGWIMILAENKMRVWIDLDNSPHAHFFPPIVRRLEEAGYTVEITARRFGQVEDGSRRDRSRPSGESAEASQQCRMLRPMRRS